MSTVESPALVHSPPAHASAGTRARAWVTIASHTAVDLFSFTIVPLLSVLEGRLSLNPSEGAALLMIGGVSSGLIQPVAAWVSDRWDTRSIGVIGFLVAVVCVGSVGFAQSYWQLVVLQLLATAGIGAYHPVAAAAVGQMSGRKRSLGVSVFYAAGMTGGVLGNLIAPAWYGHFSGAASGVPNVAQGLKSFSLWIAPGVVLVAALAFALRGVPHRHADARARHGSLTAAERRARWIAVGLLYGGNVLRFMVDMCLITLIVRWTERLAIADLSATELTGSVRAHAATINGPLQAAKQVGMGVSGIALVLLLRSKHEKATLVLVPLLGAAAIALLPRTGGVAEGWVGTALVFAVCALAGVGYGGVVPVTISLAQRLLPHRTNLASGLMMGGAWAVASVGPMIAQALDNEFGLKKAFLGVALMMVAASALGAALPGKLIRAAAED